METLLARFGVFLVLAGVGLLFKLAWDHLLLSREARLAFGYVLSLSLLGAGVWVERRRSKLGKIIAYGGTSALQVVCFGGLFYFEVLSPAVALGLSVATQVGNLVLAERWRDGRFQLTGWFFLMLHPLVFGAGLGDDDKRVALSIWTLFSLYCIPLGAIQIWRGLRPRVLFGVGVAATPITAIMAAGILESELVTRSAYLWLIGGYFFALVVAPASKLLQERFGAEMDGKQEPELQGSGQLEAVSVLWCSAWAGGLYASSFEFEFALAWFQASLSLAVCAAGVLALAKVKKLRFGLAVGQGLTFGAIALAAIGLLAVMEGVREEQVVHRLCAAALLVTTLAEITARGFRTQYRSLAPTGVEDGGSDGSTRSLKEPHLDGSWLSLLAWIGLVPGLVLTLGVFVEALDQMPADKPMIVAATTWAMLVVGAWKVHREQSREKNVVRAFLWVLGAMWLDFVAFRVLDAPGFVRCLVMVAHSVFGLLLGLRLHLRTLQAFSLVAMIFWSASLVVFQMGNAPLFLRTAVALILGLCLLALAYSLPRIRQRFEDEASTDEAEREDGAVSDESNAAF